MTNGRKWKFLMMGMMALLGVLLGILLYHVFFGVSEPFDVTPEDLAPEDTESDGGISDRFLMLDNELRDWFTYPALECLTAHFDATYPLLVNTFGGGVYEKIRYRLSDLEEERSVYLDEDGATLVLNSRYFKKDTRDFSCLARELTRALLSGVNVTNGGAWVLDGLCEYGAYLCNKDAYTPMPYDREQSYDSAKEVTFSFFLWLCEHHEATFLEQLIEGLRCEPYTPNLFVKITGYTVEELWNLYAVSFDGA